MALTQQQILEEFNTIPKNWHTIYQWSKCSRTSYIEFISDILLNEFDKIDWTLNGHRTGNFRQDLHKGETILSTDIAQFTEKRFCRALFNAGSINLLGKIIDYEIPLTEPKQEKDDKQSHGDIDLLSIANDRLFFIEAKKPEPSDSLLKAILEIFVYTYRLHKYGFINKFKEEYEITEHKSVPVVLAFENSSAGRQIIDIDSKSNKYNQLISLIDRINIELNKVGVEKIEFYVIDKLSGTPDKALKADPTFDSKNKNGKYKIVLNQPIVIKKY
ncbi:MAG TPA: hypothetical protein DCM02_11500 [Flavobacterium sp.]|nr:hypothetical protein [Flavobacterium sp.]